MSRYLSILCLCLFLYVLALVWQLMKAYTLSILTKLAGQDASHPVVEREIVAWANQKVSFAVRVCVDQSQDQFYVLKNEFAFSALTVLVERREGYPDCEI